MKGSIIERGKSYRLKVSLGKNSQTGRYNSYYETFHGSMPDAQKRLRAILTEHDKGIFIKPTKETMGEYLKVWLTDSITPNLAGNTTNLYAFLCKKHIIPALGNIPLVALKPQQLQRFYAEKKASGLSARTVQLLHVVIHKSLKNACKLGLISRNVAESIDPPKNVRHEMRVMSEADLHLFLEMAYGTGYYALFYTLCFTGMRRNEALALRWSNVDLLLCQLSITQSMEHFYSAVDGERTRFKEPKTEKSRRLIALSPSTVGVLREHRESQEKRRQELGLPLITDDELVFSNWDGSPLLPDSVTQRWRRLARQCGLSGITPHSARHTHASLLLKQGVHAKIVQERLGHASITLTLDLYSHVAPGLQQAAAQKFDDILLPKQKVVSESD